MFEFEVNSQLQGHIQTKGYEQRAEHFILKVWRHSASVIGPPNHVIMISFLTLKVIECEEETVEVLVGGLNASEATLVATVCKGGSVPDVTVYHASTVHVLWKANRRTLDNLLSRVAGFRLKFSFHQIDSPLLQQLPSGVWNCSVPHWPEFKSHFQCNYNTECAEAEDETGCPYTGHCPPGHVLAHGRCYSYVNPRGPISWVEANMLCAERYGGYLASFNTAEEWLRVTAAFRFMRSQFKFFIGLKPADSGKPHIYRRQLEWADGSVAVYLRPFRLDDSKTDFNACVQFVVSHNDIFVLLVCNQRYRYHYLCEVENRSTKPQLTNFTAPRWISSNQTLPFRHVRCPKGHMTHAFLACDAASTCFSEVYVSSYTAGAASCPAKLHSLPPPFQCSNGFERVPYSMVCDYRDDCMDGSDEDFCEFAPCDTVMQMTCGGSKQCVQREAMCDGPEHCADGSDEKKCDGYPDVFLPTPPPPALVRTAWRHDAGLIINKVTVTPHSHTCPEGFFQCVEEGYCFEVQFRCNGVRDCPGGQDEAGCAGYSCPGMYRCRGSRVCYRADKLCDGFGDCPQSDDELFCDLQCPANCTCYGWSFTCLRVFPVTLFPHLRYLDAGDSGLTARHVNHSRLLIHLSLARCGLLHLGNLTLPNLRSLNLSGNNLSAVSADEVNCLQNLQELVLANNPLTSVLLTEKQSSLNLRYLDLSHVRLPSLAIQAQLPFLQLLNLSFTGLDELLETGFQSLSSLRVIDLRGCPLTHLPRHIFQDLQELGTVSADSYRLCCQATLPTGFNRKHCHAPEDTVSSCDRLLKYDTLAVLGAICAAVSIIGNATSFTVRVFVRKPAATPVLDVFLSHLRTSDLVMGVYLAIIGLADRLYLGTYLWEDVAWRQSVICQTAGILFAVSSQVSSLVIFVTTVEHVVFLYSHRSVFGSRRQIVPAVTCVVWMLGIVSAIAPLFSSRWRHSADTAICIPLISTEQDNGSFFDLLVIPQCTLHAGVMAAQIYIFIKTRPHPMAALKADSVPPQIGDARRFSPVAICSCLCRMSLLVLALSLHQGSTTSNQVRVAASLIVLPLSSALHPVLYAYGLLQERRQAARNERLLTYLTAKRRAKVLNVK